MRRKWREVEKNKLGTRKIRQVRGKYTWSGKQSEIMATANVNIKPFDGNNFSNWQFRVKLLLEQAEVLEVVTQDFPTTDPELTMFKKKDSKAKNIVV